ncbi:MAG: hypothetical protein CMM76_17505 [Rhodospirillaceae bacterium]|nr:hypothetical protein [Rhodospirillaceae bacterium]|tara:strand:- start:45 stop:482 length:438 start_codon:yes stop_codon:yes gene_type:complete
MASDNGFIAPSSLPSSPVEWTIFDGGGARKMPAFSGGFGTAEGTVTVFEAPIAGFDSWGYDIQLWGWSSNDNVEVKFETSSGAAVASAYGSFYSGTDYVAASTQAYPVLTPKLLVKVFIQNYSGTSSEGFVNVQVFARRTSNDGY